MASQTLVGSKTKKTHGKRGRKLTINSPVRRAPAKSADKKGKKKTVGIDPKGRLTAQASTKLRTLSRKYHKSVNEITRLTAVKKSLKKKLEELGGKDKPRRKNLALDLYETERFLEVAKVERDNCASSIIKVIDGGDQLEMF